MSHKYVRILYACKKLYLNDIIKVIYMKNNKKNYIKYNNWIFYYTYITFIQLKHQVK